MLMWPKAARPQTSRYTPSTIREAQPVVMNDINDEEQEKERKRLGMTWPHALRALQEIKSTAAVTVREYDVGKSRGKKMILLRKVANLLSKSVR